jgi:hypothetical protein
MAARGDLVKNPQHDGIEEIYPALSLRANHNISSQLLFHGSYSRVTG